MRYAVPTFFFTLMVFNIWLARHLWNHPPLRHTPKPDLPILGEAYEQMLFNFWYSADQMSHGLPSLCSTKTYVTLEIAGEMVEVEYSDATPLERNNGRSYWPDAVLLGTATLDSVRCRDLQRRYCDDDD